MRQVHWTAPPASLDFVVSYQPARPGVATDPASSSAEGEATREVSFWAYPDRDTEVVVRYQASDGTWQPFADLLIPRGALLQGDSVFITMTTDSTELRVELEPTGLAFSALAPARLTLWYTGADPDFDGNGVVDAVDAYIQQTLLGLWLQVTPADPWEPIVATHSLTDRSFTATLQHFSGYAVAW